MLKKIVSFLKYDVRTKLKKFGIYPKHVNRTGLKSIYPKFIFSLIYSENSRKLKKKNFDLIFNNQNKSDTINYLVSTPSSGSMFTRGMFKSYLEIYFKIGNGIPKYDSINNQWMFSISPFVGQDLHNAITNSYPFVIPEALYIDTNKFISNEEFNKLKIAFGRFPLGDQNLINKKKIRPIILTRNPMEQIVSHYMNYDKRENVHKSQIDYKLLDEKISMYEKYINYWLNYTKEKNKNNFLIINYKDLISDSETIFKRMLIYFNYDLDENIIKKCTQIHSKENTRKLIEGIEIRKKIRFTDENLKEKQTELLKNYLTKKFNETGILNSFNKLNNIS